MSAILPPAFAISAMSWSRVARSLSARATASVTRASAVRISCSSLPVTRRDIAKGSPMSASLTENVGYLDRTSKLVLQIQPATAKGDLMKRVLLIVLSVASLAVSAGPAVARTQARCTVPKLSGVTLKVARTRLTHAHCRAGTIHRPKTASANEIVSRQTPNAGRKVKRGSKITIWLKVKMVKSTTTLTTATPAQTPAVVRASIDPTFTQDQTNPLMVTWAYDAGVNNGSLPDGTLSLTVYEHGQVASAGGCTIDVGGTISGGNCTLTLPQYGSYDVTVTT